MGLRYIYVALNEVLEAPLLIYLWLTMTSSNPYTSTSLSAVNRTSTETLPSTTTTLEAERPEPEPETLPTYHLEMRGQESVPLYTETAPETLSETLDSLRERAQALAPKSITLPITKFDPLPDGSIFHFSCTTSSWEQTWKLSHQIVNAFFRAILSKNDELVTLFVQQGLISPDCPNARGETPLIVAVTAGSGQMVCTLLNLGADGGGEGYREDSRVVVGDDQVGGESYSEYNGFNEDCWVVGMGLSEEDWDCGRRGVFAGRLGDSYGCYGCVGFLSADHAEGCVGWVLCGVEGDLCGSAEGDLVGPKRAREGFV